MCNSHLTAITRTSPSAPLKYLLDEFWILGSVLDYGCGKGMDIQHLESEFNFEVRGFDPYYEDNRDYLNHKYATILCTYVLNVIEDEWTRQGITLLLMGLLESRGHAFITVRNDKANLKGLTSKGTWQGFIECPKGWEVLTANSSYVIYHYVKK